MWEAVRRFFLGRYESERLLVRKRNASLLVVLIAMVAVSLLLGVLIAIPGLRLALAFLGVASVVALFAIRAGHADVANRAATFVISAMLASMVFLQPYREGSEIYSVVAYESMMLLVAGIVACKSRQMLAIMGVGAIGLTLDFLLRIIPGGGLADNWINYVICMGMLALSSFAGRSIMERNKLLIAMSEGEAEKNRTQLAKLQSAIISGKDALGMGAAVCESSQKTERLITRLQQTLLDTKKDMMRLSEKTRLISASNEEISNASRTVREKISDQTAVVTESSSAIEEMTASVANISGITESRQKSISMLGDTTKSGSAEMDRAAEAVRSMKDATATIADVAKVIRSVANQTNLLAMNAAIEAAHAGSAGLGFSVVANEIRKLSEETSRQIKIIDTGVKGTIASVDTATTITTGARDAFRKINVEAESVAKAMEEIRNGLAEISSGSGEILAGVTESVAITNDVKDAALTVDEKIKAAAENLDLLRTITGEVSSSIALVVAHFDEMLSEAKVMNKAGNDNAAGLVQLTEALKQLQEA